MSTKVEFIQDYLRERHPLRHDLLSDKLQTTAPAGLFTAEPVHPSCAGVNDTPHPVWRELTKRDINSIVCDCSRLSGKNITDREVRCVLQSAFVPSVHPLRDYIRRLPAYDPSSGDWLEMLAAQVTVMPEDNQTEEEAQTLWRKCFKKWFVAMVAGWMEDSAVNQQVLVLIGPQGIYKTTWLERLLPPCLRDYGCQMANVRDMDKDQRLRIAETALINIDEIDSMSDRELNQLKSVITASDVNERAAYGYSKERRLRVASFCASGNKEQFLTDTTGNRRWLPFRVASIQSPFIHSAQPYDLYYAQAWWLVQGGFNYWFDTQDIRTMETHVSSFKVESNEEQLLPVFYEPATKDTPDAVFRTAAEISAKLTYEGNIKKPMELSKLGRLLSALGYCQRRIGHGGIRGYIVIEHTNNQSDAKGRMQDITDSNADSADSADSIF